MIDKDGQPYNSRFNASLRTDRDVDELIGLCKGVLADGAVNELEAKFLSDWLDRHRECADVWPANVLYSRITEVLRDGKIAADEERELLQVLMGLTGGDARQLNAAALTTNLPIDNPLPDIVFSGRSFCFTGKFITGPREVCATTVTQLGGVVADNVKKDLDYLVLGVIGSRDWAHTAFGRKIEKAVAYKGAGEGIHIIAEEHFVAAVTQLGNGLENR